MAHSLQSHEPTKAEIVDLAALEGHDADIPSNLGAIDRAPSNPSTRTQSPTNEKDANPTIFEADVEKGTTPSSSSTVGEKDEGPEQDPNIVDFDGPDDPQNPMNWSFAKKWGTVTLVSAITFLTPLASSMFAPGVPQVMRDFDSTSDLLAGFMVSVYVLGFSFGPLIIAPMSEMYGRLWLYHSCNLLFIIFTVAAALSTNMAMFIVFRFLMGTVGGAPMVLGGGTIADIIPREHRGNAMSVWMMGPTIGPCVGPIVGGFLTVAKGWRWNFWLVAVVASAFFIMSLILMNETAAPTILARKAKRLRAETGNDKLRSKFDGGLSSKELFKFSIVRPAKMLTRSTICFAISLYIAITYTYLYILFTTFSSVFSNQYGWRGGITGLSFLGLGIGSLIGQFTYTYFGNRSVAEHMKRGDFKPEHRLHIMCIGGFFIPVGFLIYGWSTEFQTHWIVPLVGTGIVGFGMLMIFMPANTYLIDVFTMHAASAMAANTVFRSFMAAIVPLSSQKITEKESGLEAQSSFKDYNAITSRFTPIVQREEQSPSPCVVYSASRPPSQFYAAASQDHILQAPAVHTPAYDSSQAADLAKFLYLTSDFPRLQATLASCKSLPSTGHELFDVNRNDIIQLVAKVVPQLSMSHTMMQQLCADISESVAAAPPLLLPVIVENPTTWPATNEEMDIVWQEAVVAEQAMGISTDVTLGLDMRPEYLMKPFGGPEDPLLVVFSYPTADPTITVHLNYAVSNDLSNQSMGRLYTKLGFHKADIRTTGMFHVDIFPRRLDWKKINGNDSSVLLKMPKPLCSYWKAFAFKCFNQLAARVANCFGPFS
ncbi:hypothetical protein OPT61_g5384 [Boeremia exigua]|uniref:Uncharacterized protein n=1 Tax=Boeremia exigua TaxID=749465 RepID=A0ACC2IAQ3_9PLEO|nr:hypothetical protein OPT61_g5384 [Boeremia exigua]